MHAGKGCASSMYCMGCLTGAMIWEPSTAAFPEEVKVCISPACQQELEAEPASNMSVRRPAACISLLC